MRNLDEMVIPRPQVLTIPPLTDNEWNYVYQMEANGLYPTSTLELFVNDGY